METAATNTERVCTHERDITLASGAHVVIKPWGYTTGKRLLKRISGIISLWVFTQSEDRSLTHLLSESYDEIGGIIADTLNITEAEMDEQLMLEDVLVITSAILDLNFLERPQLVKAIEGLVKRAEALMEKTGPADEELETEGDLTPSETEITSDKLSNS